MFGGGFPLAAVAGRHDILNHFDKDVVGAERWLMMLGTLSGNPVAAAAGLKSLEILRREGSYETLVSSGERIQRDVSAALSHHNISHTMVGHPSLFEVVLYDGEINNYRDVLKGDAARTAKLNAVVREHGVLKSPGKIYPSMVLTESDFETIANAYAEGARTIAAS